jgi:hypothetical protein
MAWSPPVEVICPQWSESLGLATISRLAMFLVALAVVFVRASLPQCSPLIRFLSIICFTSGITFLVFSFAFAPLGARAYIGAHTSVLFSPVRGGGPMLKSGGFFIASKATWAAHRTC